VKFFHFSQNNPGGEFHVNDQLAHHVVIEAIDRRDANRRAERVGIYFDGVESERDCSYCGDRWREQWENEEGNEVPSLYGTPIHEVKPGLMPEWSHTRIHYANGCVVACMPGDKLEEK
jgi:hypothetical protein